MKAAVCRAFGEPLTIEEVHLAGPGAGEVRVAVKACAVCHSDVTYADGDWGGPLPAVYGHEAAGVVEAVGEGVSRVGPGDHVVVTLIRHCGECRHCANGHEVLCDTEVAHNGDGPLKAADGEPLHQAMYTGAFAEAVVVDQSQIEKVPAAMPLEQAALLACGVITGYGAVTHVAQLRAGDHAVVIGCGGVGLNTVQAAALADAASVIAVDLEDDKLAVARDFGATHAINPTAGDAAERIGEITAGHGADFVFVTVGSTSAIDKAFAYLSKGGALVLVGMPAVGAMSEFEPVVLTALSQRVLGTKMGSARIAHDVPALVDLYQQGRLRLEPLISGRYKLEQINEAMDGLRNGSALRNVIVFD